MTYAFFLAKFIMPAVLASYISMPQIIQTSTTVQIESPVVSAVATTTQEIVKPVGNKKGNCLEYADIIETYNWPTSTAMEVCKHESAGNATSVGDGDTEYVSCGLMQIRTLPGRPTCEELKVPERNIEYAYNLWVQEGWHPWSVCRDLVDCD